MIDKEYVRAVRELKARKSAVVYASKVGACQPIRYSLMHSMVKTAHYVEEMKEYFITHLLPIPDTTMVKRDEALFMKEVKYIEGY